MEAPSDDKQVLSIKVLRIFIRPGWGMYFRTRRYHCGTANCPCERRKCYPTVCDKIAHLLHIT
jgi:hypothetical protein